MIYFTWVALVMTTSSSGRSLLSLLVATFWILSGIRIKGEDGKTYLAHTLNNTCVAPPRMLIAFLENHLQADGTVTIPKVLQPYMGGKAVLVPNKK